MIKRKTCLILGAGASMEFGYPSGLQLFEKICNVTIKDSRTYEILLQILRNPTQIADFRKSLIHSGRTSIDEFLQLRKEFQNIGKLAIAASLIPYEDVTSLFNYRSGTNWYKLLFGKMVEDCDDINDFKKNNVSFITFNYDRSLEQFLFLSIRNAFGVSVKDAVETLCSLNIVHLHGYLGHPTCMNFQAQLQVEEGNYIDFQGFLEGEKFYRDYNSLISDDVIRMSAASLKIIHDEQNEELFETAINAIRNSASVFFLGFGYHPMNLKRLRIYDLPKSIVISGTVHGMKSKEIIKIVQNSGEVLTENKLMNCDIVEFFREHRDLN